MHGPLSDDTRMHGTPIDGIKLQAHLTRAAIHKLLIQKCLVQQMENARYTQLWYKNS
jgi:hypothetical protein